MIVGIDDNPDVVAIVPTLGTKVERLRRSLDSLFLQETDVRLAVVVVANTNDSAITSVLPEWAHVEVVGLNLGWAGGLAFGRSMVSTQAVWLVQDDMVLEPGCLDALWSALVSDSSLGMVAPLVVKNGLVAAGTAAAFRNENNEYFGWYPAEDVPLDSFVMPRDVAYIGSRGMLIPTRVWDEVGGMDPLFYPLVWADADFCLALERSGYEFALVRDAHCDHEQMGSTPRHFGALLWHRNRARLERKWFSGPELSETTRRETEVNSRLSIQLTRSIAVAAASLAQEIAQRFVEASTQLSVLSERLAEVNDYAIARERERDELRAIHDGLESEVRELRAQLKAALTTVDDHEPATAPIQDFNQQLNVAHAELARTQDELNSVLSSRSWRLSAPLRRVAALFRRGRAK